MIMRDTIKFAKLALTLLIVTLSSLLTTARAQEFLTEFRLTPVPGASAGLVDSVLAFVQALPDGVGLGVGPTDVVVYNTTGYVE